jgi:hypothetical protein
MTARRATIIVKPGTGWAVRLAADPQTITRRSVFVAFTTIILFVIGVALMAIGSIPVKVLGVFAAASGLAWVGTAVRMARRQTVTPGDWRYQGQRINGDGRTLLADAVVRAAQVEHLIAELPTTLEWNKFRPQVEGVLWNAAGHAAAASRLDEQMEGRDPDDADQLVDERREHLAVVAGARDEVVELLAVAQRAAAELNPPLASSPDRPTPRGRRSRPLSGRRPAG